MFHNRLHASPSSQGYKPLGNDTLSNSVPELSGHGSHSDHPTSRGNTIVAAKSYGDLKGLQGRARGKKTRAMRWLVLSASGERQVFTLDKRQLIQTCRLEIPIRDMRLMDSALGTETLAQLLVRDNALVFSMEHVRLIIMHDKVVVPLDDCGIQPPGPPAASQTQQVPERLASGSVAPELKDRFLAHLEGVVQDWALQHGPTLSGLLAGTASNGGVGSQPVAFGGGGGHPPVAAAVTTTGPSHHAQPATVAQQQQQSAGGAVSTVASHYEADSGSNVKGQALRGGGGAAQGQGLSTGTPSGAAVGLLVSGPMGATGHLGAAGLPVHIGGPGSETASATAFDPESQPFEMLVLETALTEICTHLSREVDALQMTFQPALEALMKTADTANLEAVRRVKTQHARLVTRVTATREALERLMEDDDDMVRMCLTQQAHMRLAAVAAAAAAAQQQHSHQHSHHQSYATLIGSITPAPTTAAAAFAAQTAATPAPLASGQSPDSPPSPLLTDAQQLAVLRSGSLSASYMRPASLAARAVRHQVGKKSGALGEALAEAAAVAAVAAAAAAGPGSGGAAGGAGGSATDVVDHDFLDVENLLESYAIIVDTTYQTLMSIGEYIDDTEDLINIQLDFSRNKLIRFDILLTSGTFALAFFNIVTGMLGENMVLPDTITQDLSGFVLVNGGTLIFCITTFLTLVMVFKYQKVI